MMGSLSGASWEKLGYASIAFAICFVFILLLHKSLDVLLLGDIGFVGLTIPHITRSIVGTKHLRLIPASVVVGGTFLVVAIPAKGQN